MELIAYWNLIRRHLGLIILLPLLGVFGTYFYTQLQPLHYEATTTLFLNPAVAKSVLGSTNIDAVQSLSNTYSEFMQTNSFIHRISTELGGIITDEEVKLALKTRYVPNTQFFRITAKHTDPTIAANLANTSAQVLIAENTVRQQAERQQIESQRFQDGRANTQQWIDLQQTLEKHLAFQNDQVRILQDRITTLEQGPSPAKDVADQLRDLRTQLATAYSGQANLINGLSRVKAEMGSSVNTTPPNIDTAVVVDVAPFPTKALSRKTIESSLLAFIICLVLGVGLSFLLEYLDNSVRSPQNLEAIYGIPALGIIQNVAVRPWKRRQQSPLILMSNPSSVLAEEFRAMRVGMQLTSDLNGGYQLLVTSAVAGEGKTFVATHLALSLAQNGKRVILVDANLRNPSLHETFGLPAQPGLSDLIIGDRSDVLGIRQPMGIEHLQVITAGSTSNLPGELLSLPAMSELMQQLAAQADVVIYDTSPVITTSDALVLAPQVDTVLQVVRARSTSTALVIQCMLALQRAGTRIIKPVLNRVKAGDYELINRHRLSAWFASRPFETTVAHRNGSTMATGKAINAIDLPETSNIPGSKH